MRVESWEGPRPVTLKICKSKDGEAKAIVVPRGVEDKFPSSQSQNGEIEGHRVKECGSENDVVGMSDDASLFGSPRRLNKGTYAG